LAVFLLLAVGVSTLVESVLASERLAASAAAREATLAEALRPDEASAADVLEVLRAELHLGTAAIVDPASGTRLVVSDPDGEPPELPPPDTAVMAVDVGPGFRVLGWGPGTLGAQPEYVTSLATAAVRAWESERLAEEQERSARLAEIDAARAALLATIGHDLRTPLAGMRVSVDALAMAGDNLPEVDRRALLEELRASALRLDTLLDGVLEAARIESGAAAQPAPTDLWAVVDAAVRDFDSPRLHVVGAAQPVMAQVDRVVAERIVANLVSNALAHTPEGSRVDVVVGDLPNEPTIRVVDHGPGLRQDRDAPDRGRQRQGMGLLIVDRLARFASIDVAAGVTDGGGTTFTLRFPAVA
jgi:two-component system sensor histidine kinase KdpD